MEKKTAFKDLSGRAKVQYIWDYYRWHIIISICAIAFLISMIHHYVTYKESVLDIMLVNCVDPYAGDESSLQEFFEQEGFDSKSEEITLDTSITFSEDDSYSTNYYSTQSFTLKVSVGDADIIFSPEFVFSDYAANGCMMPLTDFLTDEELEQYSDIILSATDPETGKEVPCGVKLTQNRWLTDNNYYADTICLSIAYATDAKDTAADFFRYILSFEE